MNYPLHPLCSLFPRMEGAEFAALRDDIKANGQREPIIVHDGFVLDGGNRLRACIEAGIEPQFMKFGGGNIASFVLSANLHRRHLTTGQLAAIVASVTNWEAAQTAGKPKSGNVAGLQTVAERAAISGASDRTQRDADKVAKADPALAVAVGQGKVTLAQAKEKVEGKPRSKKAEQTAADAEAQKIAEEAHGGETLESLLDKSEAEVRRLQAVIAASEADDLKAEAMKWRKAAAVALRRQEELQGTVVEREKELRVHVNALRRIGRAVGEDDPRKVAETVESFVRSMKAAA